MQLAIDPGTASRLSRMEQEEREQQLHATALKMAFADAITRSVYDVATFAPRRSYHGGQRFTTVGEVVFDAIDWQDFQMRAMQVLVNAAAGRGCQREAQQLLEEAGAAWADRTAG